MLTGSNLREFSKGKNTMMTTETIEGIRVISINTTYSNYMNYSNRMHSFLEFALKATLAGIRIKRHDLVFATSTPLTVAIPGISLSVLKRVPMVFEVRDLWPEIPIQIGAIKNPLLIKLLRWFEKITYKHARHYSCSFSRNG